MGRTILTAAQMLRKEIESWRPFMAILPKSERNEFGSMSEGAHKYNYAMMMALPQHPIAFQPIMISIIFEHYAQLDTLKQVSGCK